MCLASCSQRWKWETEEASQSEAIAYAKHSVVGDSGSQGMPSYYRAVGLR